MKKTTIRTFSMTPDVAEYIKGDDESSVTILIIQSTPVAAHFYQSGVTTNYSPSFFISKDIKDPKTKERVRQWVGACEYAEMPQAMFETWLSN